jgi:capsular exopolysaccharide synthesis family protein
MGKREAPQKSIYDEFDPEAPETTEFRRIATRISRRGPGERPRVLLFTSAERGEGKTTSSVLFSIVSSVHQNWRTCLIDADLHRPRVDKILDVPREPGVAEVLGDDLTLESALKSTRFERLKVLPAGGRRPFPSDLLQPDRIAALLNKLRLLFDVTVIDAPPLLPVSDPAILSREVDGVVLVVRAGKTRRDVALRGKKILEDVGANVLGVIVNNADDVLPYHYGHGYYQYSYSEEGGGDAPRPGRDPRAKREGKGRSKHGSSRHGGSTPKNERTKSSRAGSSGASE